MKYLPIFVATLLGLSLFPSSCQQKSKDGKVLDSPTTGHLSIMVDEGYKPVISSAIDVFDSIYRRATIDAVYCSEGAAFDALIRDSTQVIIVSRELSKQEIDDYFKPRGFTPVMTPVAFDAVAFIQNPLNYDTIVTQDQLKAILRGEITQWKQINPASKLGPITIVFDNPQSGTVRYAKDTIAGGVLSPSASALKTNEEVINYVAKNKNALGVISTNLISDTDDSGVQNFLKEIRLTRIAAKEGERSYFPAQAYLATGRYPYKRTVYVINSQARSGLGRGLASFLAGPTGQLIFHKDGMLSVYGITRLIEVKR